MTDPLRERVLPLLDGVRMSGGSFMARCPAHEDNRASLSVTAGKDQPVVFHCHAGCDPETIIGKLGLTWADLSTPRDERPGKPRDEWTPAGPATAVYDYTDENGTLLFQVLRTADKQFRQRVPDKAAKSGWTWKLGDVRRVLYRLPAVMQAIEAGQDVWVCEGEKDVHSLLMKGVAATCNPGGAGKWRPEYDAWLCDANVTIVADRDTPGQAHARAVAAALEGVANSVRIVEAAEGKDITDHLATGHGVEEVTVIWTDQPNARVDLAPDLWEFIATADDPYDWIVPGLLERMDRLMLTGFEGLGKALALDTPVPTPKGWTTMGDLSVGAEIFGPDGRPARVIAVTEPMTDRPCYRVKFSDGSSIVADANHQWLTETLPAREAAARVARRPVGLRLRGTDQRDKRVHFPLAVTTEQIAATLHARDGHALNHSVVTCAPLEYPNQELPVHPYVLGAWLGDGAARGALLTSADLEIVQRIRDLGEPVHPAAGSYAWRMSDGTRNSRTGRSLQARLRHLGLLENKHVPTAYLHASVEQRLELLRGLMDTDGTVGVQAGGAAVCEFSVCSERLATDVLELLHGLGIKVRMRSGPAKLEGRVVGTRWRLAFQTDLSVFHLPRKLQRLAPLRTRRAKLRYVAAVEPVPSVPVRCIQVDRADGMFVAGRECIPTHNSMLVRQLAVMIAAGIHPFTYVSIPPARVLLIDCENSERQSKRKFRPLAAASITAHHRVPDGGLRIIHRSEGVDLTTDADAAWLLERVTAHQPDILFIGPFYRLHAQNMNDEMPARQTVAVLDEARVKARCALVIEAHAGHGEQGRGRSVRPTGSSLLLRWPEFGFGLVPDEDARPGHATKDVAVRSWRGPRDERDWPTHLTWGEQWPWEVRISDAELRAIANGQKGYVS
jgi:hypothetical protein